MSGNQIGTRFLDGGEEPTRALTLLGGYETKELVSLEEAVQTVDVPIDNLGGMVWIAKRNSTNPAEGLTCDQSASVYLYTMEWSIGHDSLYKILNQKLRTEDRRCLTPWFSYLKLFLTALYKLPSLKKTVWRGVRGNVCDLYKKDVIWWGFSSCTTNIDVIKSFLGPSGPRTVFLIECLNGKNIKSHSSYQTENEILLMPATYLRIQDKTILAQDLYLIHLVEENPPYELRKSPLIDAPSASLSLQAEALPLEQIRLILCGRTGSGKSSFGNTILNKEIFKEDTSPNGVTLKCSVGSRVYKGKELFVVDTPGFLDTRVKEKEIQIEVGKAYELTATPGPHAFLLVIELNRFTSQEAQAIEYLNQIFGSKVVNHTIIVFTHVDWLRKRTVEAYLNELNDDSPLRTILEQCNHRYLAVNNCGSDAEKETPVGNLLSMIDSLLKSNGNKVYQSDGFGAIAKEIAKAKSNGTYQPLKPDGTIVLLPQTKTIIIDAWSRKNVDRRARNS